MDATWLAVIAVGALVFLVWEMGSYYDATRVVESFPFCSLMFVRLSIPML
jgi:hypothetical protein